MEWKLICKEVRQDKKEKSMERLQCNTPACTSFGNMSKNGYCNACALDRDQLEKIRRESSNMECLKCIAPSCRSFGNVHKDGYCNSCFLDRDQLEKIKKISSHELSAENKFEVERYEELRQQASELNMSVEDLINQLNSHNKFNEKRRSYDKKLFDMYGLTVVNVEDDGNCLFRAISQVIYGTQAYHVIIRKYAVDYIRQFPETFFKGIDFKERCNAYLENMSQDRYWGDEHIIQACAILYERTACVFLSDSTGTPILHPSFLQDIDSINHERLLILSNYSGVSHFNALESQSTIIHKLSYEPGKYEESRMLGFKCKIFQTICVSHETRER